MRKMILGNIPTLDYACAEAINTLATNITFSGSQYKSVMITSCEAHEGKSYISFHVARTLGNMGYQTVLVDADLRKSVFFSAYDAQIVGPRTGLAHLLAGHCQAEDVLYQLNLQNMYVVPTGKEIINSLPLLTSTTFFTFLESLKRSFDFIIVDAPPIGLLIDAAMIASNCDATLLVVTNDITKREMADAVSQIQKSKCTILGAVLNKVTMETHKSRKYYYKSYYSHYGDGYGPESTEQSDAEQKATSAPRSREKNATAPKTAAQAVPAKPQAGPPPSGVPRPQASTGQRAGATGPSVQPGATMPGVRAGMSGASASGGAPGASGQAGTPRPNVRIGTPGPSVYTGAVGPNTSAGKQSAAVDVPRKNAKPGV